MSQNVRRLASCMDPYNCAAAGTHSLTRASKVNLQDAGNQESLREQYRELGGMLWASFPDHPFPGDRGPHSQHSAKPSR